MDLADSKRAEGVAATQAFPRLSINHLLLLTLLVAFSLACVLPELQDVMGMQAELFAPPFGKWRSIASTLLDAMAAGICLFGFVVVTFTWRRERTFIFAPGHWYFLIHAPSIGLLMISQPLFTLAYFRWGENYVRELSAAMSAVNALAFLVGVGICTLGIWRVKALRWKLCLAVFWDWLACMAVLSVSKVCQGLWSTPGWYHQHLFNMWGSLLFVVAASFVVAVVGDARAKIRRDWLHYLAIVTLVLYCVATALSLGPFLVRWWSSAINRLLLFL